MAKHSKFLLEFAARLKARDALPKNIELSRLGPVILASIYDELNSEVVAESIFTGMDVDPDIAVLKGLVEMIERRAFGEGKFMKYPSCQTDRSDGFAAFPVGVVASAAAAARSNALNEAIERYAWSSWWDQSDIDHGCSKIEEPIAKSASGFLLSELSGILPVDAVYRISPRLANGGGSEVAIFFAFLKPFGVISGGACGSSTDVDTTDFRALCELSRHALGLRKIIKGQATPSTFYERRLAYFGQTEVGSAKAMDRILDHGTQAITLPRLDIDEVVPHKLDDLVQVYRCHFKDQPPFVGGALERLCL